MANHSSPSQTALDAEEVLDALRQLIPQVASPVVQECLRSARCEIAYLTSTEGTLADQDDPEKPLEEALEALKDAG